MQALKSERARGSSEVVGAAQVIAALGAYQLAVVACEPVAAGGAHLAMVLDCPGAGTRAGSGRLTM